MEEGEALDAYAGKIGGMAARYAGLGSTLDDTAMVKKLLDTVPDRLYAAVAGIEQFCDVETKVFEEALSRLKAFDERLRRRTQDNGGRGGDQLMFAAAQWEARQCQRGGNLDHDDVRAAWLRARDDGAGSATTVTFVATSPVTAGSRRRRRSSPTSTTSRPYCRSCLRGRLLGIRHGGGGDQCVRACWSCQTPWRVCVCACIVCVSSLCS
ncbi:hypothetical protein VPH35_045584 [Triticum aestivum]